MTGNIWILLGVIAGAFSLYAIPHGFDLKSNEKPQTNMQVAGDYVAGDKIINNGYTKEELKEIVKNAINESKPALSTTFGDEYAAFGISKSGILVPDGNVPPGLDINWKTGRVIKITDETIEVLLPDIIINTEHMKNSQFFGNKAIFPNKIGSTIALMNSPDFSIKAKLIGIDKNLIVVGLGFAPDN